MYITDVNIKFVLISANIFEKLTQCLAVEI